MNDWKKFTDVNGDFQLANFLYKSINDLMKHSLDMGTLLSDDQQKLRAYKEQTKKMFKNKWYEIAKALEAFSIIDPCICANQEKEVYCDTCKGARYIISSTLTPDEMREVGLITNAGATKEIIERLQKSLNSIISEYP